MAATDRQVQKLLRIYGQSHNTTRSALAAGLCRQTGAKYLRAGRLPSELARPHTWRTRPDPLAAVWEEVVGLLGSVPQVPATEVLARLQRLHPGHFHAGHLRTLQRRLQDWRARTLAQEVFFAQEHLPGEWLQIDWTRGDELGVTIRGEPFDHLLAHAVFPFSNWQWASVCRSENFGSLVALVGETVDRAGGLPGGLQTDHSSTVTHRVDSGRAFNEPYASFLAHFGLKARTINLRSPQENGDVESAHRHFRRYVNVALGLRGSRDFASEAEYGQFLARLLSGRNAGRAAAWAVESRHLRPPPTGGLAEAIDQDRRVDSGSLVRLDQHVYSVPSSYIGEWLHCRVGWERIEFRHGVTPLRSTARVYGEHQGVQWRDLIAELARKPGAFAGYRYREAFFPSVRHREFHRQLQASAGLEAADRIYLGLLAATRDLPDDDLRALLVPVPEPPRVPSRATIPAAVGPLGHQTPEALELRA
jgi:transposase